MASKLQNFFQQDKNSAAQELQSPAPPLKRKVIFRHSEGTVIVIPKMMGSAVNHIFNEDYFKPTV